MRTLELNTTTTFIKDADGNATSDIDTASNDLALTDTGVKVLDDADNNGDMLATKQTVLKAIQLWLGEWGRDTTRGVDWLGVMEGNYPRGALATLIRRALSRLNFIREVVQVSIIPLQNRTLDVRLIIILANNQRIEL